MTTNKVLWDRICGSPYFGLTYLVIALLIVLFYSESTSPIYVAGFGDSAVFKMMGHVLLNGGVPYVDYFDHKGPNLYIINAIGEYVSPIWGLPLLQGLCLSATLVLWSKLAQLFVRPALAFVVTLLSIFCLLDYYEYGNLIEEWCLLPSTVCLYLSISYLICHANTPHQQWRSLVYGLCFGFMFFIRPNDAVIICGGVMTGIFLYIFYAQKRYADAMLNALAFVGGYVAMAAPWIVYFAYHHAIDDFYFGLIEFNMRYSGSILGNLSNYKVTFKLVLLFIIPISLLYEARQKVLLWLLIPIGIFTILLLGRQYLLHYYMTLIIVCYLILFALLFRLKIKAITVICALLLILTPNYHLGAIRGTTYLSRIMQNSQIDYPTKYVDDYPEFKSGNIKNLFAFIPAAELDSIWNYSDTYSAIFYHCGIIAQNPVPPIIASQYGFFPAERQKSLDISAHKPLWILSKSDTPYILPTDSAYIADHYHVAKQSESTTYILLKRKDVSSEL